MSNACNLDPNWMYGKFYAFIYALKQFIEHEKNYSPFLVKIYAVYGPWNIDKSIYEAEDSFPTQTTN
jgi:hypothetical protein